jgi:maltose alpha-D-glucosyltransferase/alpha-amylase
MKKTLVLSCSLFVILLASAQKYPPTPIWLKTATFYQIYPQSFKDTNGDGIGDINGIIEKLDYIKWLGCDALWLNPCFESSFQDAGYDVTDYYKVAKRYGTNADLKRLFLEAHKRGMKVCLDLVAGHTSIDYVWFKESQRKEKNKYSDRYIWSNDSTVKPYKYVSGKFERNGAYRKNFFDCQPALNYGFGQPDPTHPWEQPVTAEGPQSTRRELMKIMDFWLDMGCNGFRVDMAPSLIKNDPDKTETNKLWAEIRNHVQKRHPQSILIAEWGNPEAAIKAGFMMDFIIHFGEAYSSLFFNNEGTYPQDTCYFSLKGNGTPTKFVDYFVRQLKNVGQGGYICVPTANHDFQRPACGERTGDDQLKTVMIFLMTIPGVPLIYYGDEIGLRFIPNLPNKEGSLLGSHNRAGTRTPMQWNNTPEAGFSTTDPSKFYLPVDTADNRPSVESQRANPESLLNFTRKLIAYRKLHHALSSRGNIKFLYAQPYSYPLVYERSAGKEHYLVVINPSGQSRVVEIENPYGNKILTSVFVKGVNAKRVGSKLNLQTEKLGFALFNVE